MRILFLSDLRKKRNTGFEIIRNLREMNFEVYPLNIKGILPDLKLKRILKYKKPEILFTFKGVGKIKFEKIKYEFKKKILWYPDTDIFLDGKFNDNLKEIFDYHDYIFIIVKSKIDDLKKLLKKENVYHMVQAARFFEYRIEDIQSKYKSDISFIGSLSGKSYSIRRKIIAKICKDFGDKYKIKLFGQSIEKGERNYDILKRFHTNKRVFFENFKKVCVGSKIVIDIPGDQGLKEEGALSQKIFMITGCGGFLLTHYFKGIEEFFEVGKEIEIFRDEKEACEKIEYYIKNEREREEIAKNGKERTLKEHLYKNRLKKIFEICKI